MGDTFITTYTNINFSIENATDDMILPQDIAHSLSLLCRANGHIKHFYSVGLHSLNCYYEAVARGLSERVQRSCLLHDASEAYLSDLTRPVKTCIPKYLVIEANVQNRIYSRFRLADLTEDERRLTREIDDALLLHEFDRLHAGGAWETPPPVMAQLRFDFIVPALIELELLELLLKSDA